MMDIALETTGSAEGTDGFPVFRTNFWFQLDRANGAVLRLRLDGRGPDWTSLGLVRCAACQSAPDDLDGAATSPRNFQLTNCELAALAVVVSTNVPRTLNYQLVNPPAQRPASIPTALSTWQTTSAQAPSTNLFMTVVTDNGSPPISLTNTFEVVVLGRPELTISPAVGAMTISCPGELAAGYCKPRPTLDRGSVVAIGH